MFAHVNDIKTERMHLVPFGGYNHTLAARPGEWYDLVNITDAYAPFLAPRRCRQKEITLPGRAQNMVFKNGVWYYNVPGEGIYCYAPQGENPFGGQSGEAVCIFASEHAYQILEMGNSLLCLPEEENAGAVSIKNGRVKKLGANENNIFRSYFPHPLQAGEELMTHSYLLTNQKAIYTYYDAQSDRLRTVETPVQKENNLYRDEAADALLNITFTYAFENDDGSWYWLHAREPKFNPETANFRNSRYFLGTDNQFYYYDVESGAVTQITAPQIVVLFHFGMQQHAPSLPDIGEGSYINLTVGPTLNRNHSLKKSDEPILSKQLLRISKVLDNVSENTTWGPEGWTHALICDYNASFIKLLQDKDLIFHSKPYTLWVEDAAPQLLSVSDDSQQIYPEYIELESAFPAISHCVEHNNRIWGVNNANNEIKASALGNFEVWDDYRGLASDSYAVSVGSNDAFTASCVIEDTLYFFKEHSYTVLYGTRPSNYCTNTLNDFIGMDQTGAKSLQVIGKTAYFWGIDGRVYAFTGGRQRCISKEFGEEVYRVISAAHSGEKYFLHLEDEQGTPFIFVYNTENGVWVKEDARHVHHLANVHAQACAVCLSNTGAGGNQTQTADILLLENPFAHRQEESRVEWRCESALIGLEVDYHRYLNAISLTFESEKGARVSLYARYDNEKEDTPLATFFATQKGTQTQKVTLRRCAFFRLIIEGIGESRIYHMAYHVQQGSEK